MSNVRGSVRQSFALPVFLAALTVAAAFIAISGSSLPPIVASHFGTTGTADGFMPRAGYLAIMLAAAIGLPLLVVLTHGLLRLVPSRFINLPNRQYWLAPERIAATFAFLHTHSMRFACVLTAFLCFVHWLVVQANAVQPPRLSSSLFIAGLLAFLVALAVWLGALFVHFRRRP